MVKGTFLFCEQFNHHKFGVIPSVVPIEESFQHTTAIRWTRYIGERSC